MVKLLEFYDWFKENLKILSQTFPGQYILITEKSFQIFNEEWEAYKHGETTYGLGNFIVQKCQYPQEVHHVF